MSQALVDAAADGVISGHASTLHALERQGLCGSISWDSVNKYTATLTEEGRAERQRQLDERRAAAAKSE